MNTVKKNIGFNRREDLDFSDDGSRFRGFDYKGILPITTTTWDGKTYLSLRVDYLDNEFTPEEWREAGGWALADMYNGTSEDFTEEELIELCEKVIALRDELNEKARQDVPDSKKIYDALLDEVGIAVKVICDMKRTIDIWELFDGTFSYKKYGSYEADKCLNAYRSVMVCARDAGKLLKKVVAGELDRRTLKTYEESLDKYGYIKIRETNYAIENAREILEKYGKEED